MTLPALNTDAEFQKVLQSGQAFLVKFTADW